MTASCLNLKLSGLTSGHLLHHPTCHGGVVLVVLVTGSVKSLVLEALDEW